MVKYNCASCDMSVKGLTCNKCNSEMKHGRSTGKDGKDVQVTQCPQGCGQIKSPVCCGQDMKATA